MSSRARPCFHSSRTYNGNHICRTAQLSIFVTTKRHARSTTQPCPAARLTRGVSRAALPAHHAPMTFHQIGPASSQMAMWTTPRTSPVRHHAPSSTYPDPKYRGAGPLP